MVHKSCKRGVHSGNTLRASSSRYTRRYHGNSCIVRRLLAGSEEVEDSYLRDEDVLYSLNKKGRWRLPKLLRDNIQQGLTVEGSPATAPVSLLERHKLKRQANCVAVATTSGRLRRRPITAKNGLYFNGLSVLNAGRGKRKRRRRRPRAESEAGTSVAPSGAVQEKEEETTVEAEVRYETYLPSSATSSISHNPKYICKPEWSDAAIFPETSFRCMKSVRGKARRRMTTRFLKEAALDLDDFSLEDDLSDVDDDADISTDYEDQQRDSASGCWQHSLQDLIASAERARTFCGRHGRREHSTRQRGQSCAYEDKDHLRKLVLVDNVDASDDVSETTTTWHSPTVPSATSPCPESVPVRVIIPDSDVTSTQLSMRYAGHFLEADCEPRRFILDISEQLEKAARSFGNLRDLNVRDLDLTGYLTFTYEGFYDAGLSVYGVTLHLNTRMQRLRLETVWELSQSSVEALVDAALAYVSTLGGQDLVARQAETPVPEASLYSLTFQHVRHARREVMENFHPEELVSNVLRELSSDENQPHVVPGKVKGRKANDSEEGREVQLPSNRNKTSPSKDIEPLTAQAENSLVESDDDMASLLETYDLLCDHAELPSGKSGQTTLATPPGWQPCADLAAAMATLPDEESRFCNICFAEVGADLSDSPDVTWLRACAHVFCNDCWRRHLSEGVASGSRKLLCPEFRCEAEVDSGTVLALLSLSQVRQWRRRQLELRVTSSAGQAWCPNPRCGRVLRLRGRGVEGERGVPALSVACACGWTTCLSCGGEAHWPASCLQGGRYRDRLTIRKDDVLAPNDSTSHAVLKGKHCPTCNEFMEKTGGCNYMICRCQVPFCWVCLVPYTGHLCTRQRKRNLSTFRNVRIAHIGRPATEATEAYLKALQHRSQRTPYKIAALKAGASKLGARLTVLHSRGVDVGLDLLENAGFPATGPDGGVTHFLSDVAALKLELHHVMEHTAILLESGQVGRSRRKIRSLLESLWFLCETLGCLLQTEERRNLRRVMSELLTLQRLAGAGLRALVRVLEEVPRS